MLKQIEVIGARGRQWPIRDGKDQLRLLRDAVTARATPSQPSSQKLETDLPHRPSSAGKRRIKDPYAAESLTELISPVKEVAEPESGAKTPSRPSTAKKYTPDPYGAGSLTELLSPTKKARAPVSPFAPAAGRPAQRNFSDIFVKDDDVPDSRTGPVDENRHYYKSVPGKYDHFEIGGDNSNREIKAEVRQANTKHDTHWDFNDVETPVKGPRVPRGQEVRHFGFGDDEEGAGSPQTKQDVAKPRRDADRHFDMTDEESADEGRVISSFGGRGKRLYENRLFDDNGQPQLSEREQKDEPLSTGGNVANRKKNFVSQFDLADESPVAKENKPTPKHDAHNKMMESHWDNYDEATPPKPTQNHDKHNKMMESHWGNFDEASPEPVRRNATAQRNPLGHNQPSWAHEDN